MSRIFICWLAGGMVVANVIIARLVIPALINMQNDGALVLALLLLPATLTADWLVGKHLFALWNEGSE